MVSGEDYPLWLVRHFIDDDGHDEAMVRATLASMSLSFHEKNRVLTTSLCEFQISKLHEVFADERKEFQKLLGKEVEIIFQLNADTVLIAFLLVLYHGARFSRQLETAYVRRMAIRAGRHGARSMLCKLPDDFWEEHKASLLVWRHAMPRDHLSWKLCGDASGEAAVPALI